MSMDPDVLPDSGSSMYQGTPFGDDASVSTHSLPAPDDADDTMPGEQPDPRC